MDGYMDHGWMLGADTGALSAAEPELRVAIDRQKVSISDMTMRGAEEPTGAGG
jgi:hypothetical protein